MIYFSGSNPALINQLANLPLTNNLNEATCAVIEMPGQLELLEQINTVPVIVVTFGMLNFREVKTVKKHFSVPVDQVANEVQKYLVNDTPAISEESEDDFFDFEEEEKPNVPIAPIAKPVINSVPQHSMPVQSVNNNPFLSRQQSLPNRAPIQPTIAKPIERKPEPIYEPPKAEPVRETKVPPAFLQRNSRRSPIVVSFSAEGGAGKTMVASSIGCYAAMMGLQPVVVDLDLGFGDMDTALGLVDPINRIKIIDKKAKGPTEHWVTVSDWRRYAVNMRQNILQHNSGLYVIPAYPYAGQDISESEIEELLYTVSEIFGLVVIDLGVDGFSPHARVALRMADTVMMVGGQSEKTLGKISHFLRQEGGYSNKISLVVNKVSPTGFYTPKEVAQKLGFDEHFEIPWDEKSVNSAKKQHKTAVQLANSPAGEAVKNYANQVLPLKINSTASTKKPAQKTKAGISFMQKLKGIFTRG